MRNSIFYKSLLVVAIFGISGCGGGGGSSASSRGSITRTVHYPNIKKSEILVSPTVAKIGEPVVVTISIKNENGNVFSLGSIWTANIQVTCQDCSDANYSADTTTIYNSQNVLKYEFTPKENNDYSIALDFEPSPSYTHYLTDFPNSIDPSDLYADNLTVSGFDVCANDPDTSYHGLKGSSVINGVERLAICSAQDLALVASDNYFLDKDFYLAKDVDLLDYYNNGGAEFSIGTSCEDLSNCHPFIGSFDGQDHTISGFKRSNGLGLFGFVDAGEVLGKGLIENLHFVDSVQSGGRGGAIAYALAEGAELLGVSVEGGSLQGTDTVGGLVGTLADSFVINSACSTDISGNKDVGGLVAVAASNMPSGGFARVSTSEFMGTIENSNNNSGYIGGLVAKSSTNLQVNNSLFSGSINSVQVTGGLVGLFQGNITNSYSSGAIQSSQSAGALFGDSDPGFSNSINAAFETTVFLSTYTNFAGGLDCQNVDFNRVFTEKNLTICGQQDELTQIEDAQTYEDELSWNDFINELNPLLVNWGWTSTTWEFFSTDLPKIFF